MKRTVIVLLLAGMALMAYAEPIITNAITINVSIKDANKNFTVQRTENNYRVNQTEQLYDAGIIALTNTTSVVNIQNVTTPHYAFFRNQTNANVQISATIVLEPGDVALFPIGNTNVTAWATNATIPWARLEYHVFSK